MKSNTYAWEKFSLASNNLRVSSLNKRQALENAYMHNILHVQENELPQSLLSRLHEIQNPVTLPKGVAPIGGHNGCAYAISNLSDEEVNYYIEKIHEIYEILNQQHLANFLCVTPRAG